MSVRSVRRVPRVFAAVLLLLLFVGMSLGSIRHAHSAVEAAARGGASACAGDHGCVAAPDHDCGLCDFASRLVAPPAAVEPFIPLPVLAAAPAAVPPLPHVRPSSRRRERASSRAPPVPAPFSPAPFGA